MTMPLMKTMCKTCPFRKGSPYAYLVPELTQSALSSCSRICHQTGNNAIANTGKPSRICRGARTMQLDVLHKAGFLPEPTDAAWTAKCAQLGFEQDSHKR